MLKDHTNPKVISFKYTLKNTEGLTLDSSEGESVSFLTGASQILPALEKELLGMLIGQRKTIQLSPLEAYGEHNPDLVIEVPREELSHIEIQEGTLLRVHGDEGGQVVRVVEINQNRVTLDGNHPLAGQTLIFDIEVTHSRDATAEEISHGHAHGPGGHRH
ncbi:MAG: peptidylprolyl isomerase [Bdellovibrionaceae bacterium]|nr:peptidylprolyl isomerase [Pseudobdellovibrionaceae bacterium]MDW8190923.1 peptidylprolyl isomerase [Pseudobdellovibrionaceae bacterium]